MLEIEGVNGEIKVLEGTILDNIIETVNGDVSISAAPESLSVSLINGDIRITAKEKTLRRVEASSANGNIKLALPNDLGVEGQVKTNLGSINSRLTDIEVVREKIAAINNYILDVYWKNQWLKLMLLQQREVFS